MVWGAFNIIGLIIFLFGLYHQTKDYYHWFYKPLKVKPEKEQTTLDKLGIVYILHYMKAFFQIIPIMSLILVVLVLLITAPVFGIFPFNDETQYSIVGVKHYYYYYSFLLHACLACDLIIVFFS